MGGAAAGWWVAGESVGLGLADCEVRCLAVAGFLGASAAWGRGVSGGLGGGGR